MPFSRPDLSDLMAQTALLLGDLPQVSPVVRRLILRAVARTQAGMVWSEHGYLAWLAEQLMRNKTDDDGSAAAVALGFLSAGASTMDERKQLLLIESDRVVLPREL